MTVEDDSASRPWFAACRGSGKRKRSTDAVLQQRQASPVVPPSSDIEEYYSRAYSQIKVWPPPPRSSHSLFSSAKGNNFYQQEAGREYTFLLISLFVHIVHDLLIVVH